ETRQRSEGDRAVRGGDPIRRRRRENVERLRRDAVRAEASAQSGKRRAQRRGAVQQSARYGALPVFARALAARYARRRGSDAVDRYRDHVAEVEDVRIAAARDGEARSV